ncbi:UNVERIFIED_CONTAM: hypothetical protein GTU68_060769 [Idotea baltica]|nr:hypothetical protein [Idotea baltica]
MPHLVIAHPDALKQDVVTLRIHSECVTGDIFSSKRCDCGEQLARGLMIARRDKGMVIYLRQEGRGIGLINKLKAYNLQDQGFNTFDANEHLGFEADARQYDMALAMLDDLGVKKIRLLTNNPEKLDAFEGSSVDLVEHLPIIIDPNDVNLNYLKTKQDVMGHLLKIED